MKQKTFLIIFLILICISFKLYSRPKLVIEFDIWISFYLEHINHEKHSFYRMKSLDIRKALKQRYNEAWDHIDANIDRYPWCVKKAIEKLNKLDTIVIFFNSKDRDLDTLGDKVVGILYTEAIMSYDRTFPRINVFGIWKKKFYQNELKAYYTSAVLVHELFHLAHDIVDKKYFKIRNLKKRDNSKFKGTNSKNLYEDEAITDDCAIKAFTGRDRRFFLNNYLIADEEYTESGARKYNTKHDDCAECKLCNNKNKPK